MTRDPWVSRGVWKDSHPPDFASRIAPPWGREGCSLRTRAREHLLRARRSDGPVQPRFKRGKVCTSKDPLALLNRDGEAPAFENAEERLRFAFGLALLLAFRKGSPLRARAFRARAR
jgi:hypothetical protein